MEGRGRGVIREGGLINFPPLKRGGGLIREGGLNKGFMELLLSVIYNIPNKSTAMTRPLC